MATVFSSICMAFCAAVTLMLTKFSKFAEVGIESTHAGWAKTLFSEASVAAVYCTVIKPLFIPIFTLVVSETLVGRCSVFRR